MRWRISGNWARSAFVKPLTGSRGDFAQALHDEAALVRYLGDVAQYYDAILMQPIVAGNEYRVFLLDDEVLFTARKHPPSVVGDGVSSIRDLLSAHNHALQSRGLSPVSIDPDAAFDTVLPEGERWEIPGRMNLSAGGTMVLEAPPSDAALTLARQAARALGLRVAAIDLFSDIGGDAERDAGDRGQFQPVDPPAGAIRSRRPDPENLASYFFRDGTALVFDLPKFGNGICLAEWPNCSTISPSIARRLTRISVVVTGSNGKGSTAAFCAGIGRAYGLRTGLFTSPHLYRFNERVQVDGVEIGDADLARLYQRIEAAIAKIAARRGEQFGAFEALFALACLHFQETACDFAVFEAGIGGRYDVTRLVGALTTCVTSVDYEHVALLGHSLDLIASDKSDACASGGTIVYGENCRSLRPHLIEYNRHREVTSRFVRDEIAIGGETATASRQQFDFRFGAYEFRSAGNQPARRIPVQQCRHRGHPVPALAAPRAARRRCRRM